MFKGLPFTSALLVSTALMAGAVSAADIVEEPAPIFSWAGFYIGVHGGAIFGQNHNDGCGAFTDLVEQGGIPTGEDAECEDLTIEGGEGPHEGGTFPAFEFPGGGDDAVAVISNG